MNADQFTDQLIALVSAARRQDLDDGLDDVEIAAILTDAAATLIEGMA